MSISKPHVLQLFQKEYQNLFKFIKYKVKCPDLTFDLLQDLYLKLQSIPVKKEISNPKGYLNTAARNLIIDNSRKPYQVLETGLDDKIDQAICNQSSPEQSAINQNMIEQLNIALSQLPHEKQDLLTLSRVYGWTNTQIAKHKNKSLSWVEKNLALSLIMCSEIAQEQNKNGQ
ncbi:RNA polymerase sigma factor [Pseudoalteromonas denitrificans]|uniref:RNA polymerase sigma-70 factor, ECF subfamily n=1 Tax=Pseudoalteromonas denitrificans DSM 6059 TaxID=1123010 RepID=A0A1I1I9S0_9GAMM|nr:sigma-70 family RNA polymerase sigma factor [Pseudoalteromonas denitrificans]SFC32761.1 RNA polymerase sigma-70 factor, ECF subfamily [Pseudoalteromonas denitrificans DSM 6059]